MAVRIGVRERRIVDELDAVGAWLDQKQGRQALVTVDDVGDDDQHARDVARGHEPLLTDDPIPVAGRDRDRRDPRRIGPGLGLGHRVRVAALAAQRRRHVALELLGRRVGPDVVDIGHVPVQAVGAAAELLVDEEPLEHRPALAAALHVDPAAVQPGGDRLALDLVDRLDRQPPQRQLGRNLERDQHVFDEPLRAIAQLTLVVGQRIGSLGCRHTVRPFGRVDVTVCERLVDRRSSRARSPAVSRAPAPGSASSRL